jgi:hypothetical protein
MKYLECDLGKVALQRLCSKADEEYAVQKAFRRECA